MKSISSVLLTVLIFLLTIQFILIPTATLQSSAATVTYQANDLDASFIGERETLYGETVSSIGDYNSDGYEDFIVGGRMYSDWRGKVWIYYGGPNGPEGNQADFTIIGEPNRGGWGVCMGHNAILIGDVNQDGIDDFAASGPGSYGDWDVGKVYIFYGGNQDTPSIASEADQELVSPITYDWFGETMSPAGDFNGDGIPDIVVGAPGTNWAGNQANLFENGKAYIFLGTGDGFNPTADITLSDTVNRSAFGRLVTGDGDINGDGLDDVVIGASWRNNFTGSVHVYLGSEQPDSNPEPDLLLEGDYNLSYYGEYLSIVDDLNGDGYDEIAVQAKNTQANPIRSEVKLYFGGESISDIEEPDMVFYQEDMLYFGEEIASVGDLNGDGYADMAVGSPELSVDKPGSVFVYYGGPEFNTTASRVYHGEDGGDQFGYAIASAHLDGDDKLDLIMTSLSHDDQGKTYIDLTAPPQSSSVISNQTFLIVAFLILLTVGLLLARRKFRS